MSSDHRSSSPNVISFEGARKLRNLAQCDLAYQAKILGMSKLELLEEMIRFQEERTRLGSLTLELMTQGKVLFKALEENAETRELRLLTGSYRRHLELELHEYLTRHHG